MQLPPKSLSFNGKIHTIQTDFRVWASFPEILCDERLTEIERINYVLECVYGFVPTQPEEQAQALEQLSWFLCCGANQTEEALRDPLLDWREDFDTVWADFKTYTNMDLREISYLHWWDFMNLIASLPPHAQIKRKITVRGTDLGKIKDPQTREEYRQLKELYTIPCNGRSGLDMDEIYSGVAGNYS